MLALKKLLPVEPEDAEPSQPPSLARLEPYLELPRPQLLAQIRHRVTPAPTPLDLEQLWTLKRQFDAFDDDIGTHIEALKPVETMLTEFDAKLSELSQSLLSLQTQLQTLTLELGNAHSITNKLNPVILDLLFPPDTLRSIASAPVNPQWMDNIKVLQEKQDIIDSVEKGPNAHYKEYKAYDELRKTVEVATAKAVERIRDFMIAQIKLLRSPKLSSQQVQQLLLQCKEAFHFLKRSHPELARQFLVAYIWTMRWYYHTRFAKYLYCLQKLQVKHADYLILVGADVLALLLFFGKGLWFLSAPAPGSPTTEPTTTVLPQEYYSLMEKRHNILTEEATAIPSQIAETTPFSYWLEFIYQQWLLALVSNVVVEYLFIVDFFNDGEEKFPTLDNQQWWDIMYGPVFGIGKEFVTWLVTHTPSLLSKNANLTAGRLGASIGTGLCDAFGVLLVIRLVQRALALAHDTYHIPVLDDYHQGITLQLWSQFTKIVDQNCELMKRAFTQLTLAASRGAPLSVTQQVAQLIGGMLRISTNHDIKAEPLHSLIQRLSNEYESQLTKLATLAFSSKRSTEREVFLYNNYFLVALILRSEIGDLDPATGAAASIEAVVAHFDQLTAAYKQ